VDKAIVQFTSGRCDLTVSVDPGRTFAAYAYRGEVHTKANGMQRSLNIPFSTKGLRHDSKMKEMESWMIRARDADPAYVTALRALPSLKVGNFQTYKVNLRQTLAQAAVAFNHHEQKRKYRAWRFKVSRFTKKALAQAAKKMTKKRNPAAGEPLWHSPDRTIIGWGDWSQQDGFLRGTPKAPVKKLRRAFKKMGFTIVEVDEHRTSKNCSACHHASDTSNVSYNGVSCHQVVRCNNSECGLVWQRDCNASRNIYEILHTMLLGQDRPEGLRRA